MKMAIFTDGTQDEGAIDHAITEPTPPSFEKTFLARYDFARTCLPALVDFVRGDKPGVSRVERPAVEPVAAG